MVSCITCLIDFCYGFYNAFKSCTITSLNLIHKASFYEGHWYGIWLQNKLVQVDEYFFRLFCFVMSYNYRSSFRGRLEPHPLYFISSCSSYHGCKHIAIDHLFAYCSSHLNSPRVQDAIPFYFSNASRFSFLFHGDAFIFLKKRKKIQDYFASHHINIHFWGADIIM